LKSIIIFYPNFKKTPCGKLFNKLLETLKDKKIISKIKRAEFTAEESERLVEGLLLGRNFLQAPFITSRICGICPTAHNLCSLSALENALNIHLSKETMSLRKILACGQIIKSHLLHLFFLVLPGYTQVKGAIELSKKYPAEFHLMLNIKRIADEILKTIGGTVTFPVNTMPGGFRNPPEMNKLLAIKTFIFEIIDESQGLIKLFASLKIPGIEVNTKLMTITPPENSYPFYPGNFPQKTEEIVQKNLRQNLES